MKGEKSRKGAAGLLVLLLCFCMLPVQAFASVDEAGESNNPSIDSQIGLEDAPRLQMSNEGDSSNAHDAAIPEGDTSSETDSASSGAHAKDELQLSVSYGIPQLGKPLTFTVAASGVTHSMTYALLGVYRNQDGVVDQQNLLLMGARNGDRVYTSHNVFQYTFSDPGAYQLHFGVKSDGSDDDEILVVDIVVPETDEGDAGKTGDASDAKDSLDEDSLRPGLNVRDGEYCYIDQNGNMVKDRFMRINGATYYFGSDGSAVKGRIQIGSDTYFFWRGNASMATNRWVEGRYYGSDGKEAKQGWLSLNGFRYHIDADGLPETGRVKIGSDWCFFWRGNASMATNRWIEGRYYGADGKEAKQGWLTLAGVKYHIDQDGICLKGRAQIEGDHYFFWRGNASMATNRWIEGRYYGADGKEAKQGWLAIDGFRYHIGADGLHDTGRTQIGGYWYFFWRNVAAMATNSVIEGHYYAPDGREVSSGWVSTPTGKLYLLSAGVCATGRTQIGGNHYFFWRGNTTMATNRWIEGRYYGADGKEAKQGWLAIDGFRYHIGADGLHDTGRTQIGADHYFFWRGNASMATDRWIEDHYYGMDGREVTKGWIRNAYGPAYLLDDGSMARGRIAIGNDFYFFWRDHAYMATNVWVESRYYRADGREAKPGWFYLSGNWYYIKLGGMRATGQQQIDGKWYFFWRDIGVMATNAWVEGHYYLSDGTMAVNRWVDDEQFWVDGAGNVVPGQPAKTGYQNPWGYYQLSSKNVRGIPAGYYVTPSRIMPNATRSECVEAFIGRAWEYIGTPYVWNYSNAPGVGVDCIGLVYQCAYACGMDLGEFNPYDHWITGPTGWHSHDANNMWNYGAIQRLSLASRQRGDLIFWRGHVAIYLGGDRIIEAYPGYVRECSLWAHGTPIGVGRMFL